VLELAAKTGPGAAATDDADVRVVAGDDGAWYEVGDRTVAFDDLVERATGDATAGPAADEAASAGSKRRTTEVSHG